MEISQPATRRQLLVAGSSANQLDARLRTGDLSAPFRGIYVAGSAGVANLQLSALLTQAPGAVLSHRTAAVLHNLRWLPTGWLTCDDLPVDMTVGVDCTRRQRGGMRLFRSSLDARDLTIVGGLPVTTAARTVIDLIRSRDVDRLLGLQLLDGGLRFGHFTGDELQETLERLAGRRGVKRAAELVALARPGVDSPGETWLRLTLVDGGVDPADIETGIEIRDDAGLVTARSDLGSRRLLLWWEYDGRAWHDEDSADRTGRDTFGSDRIGDRALSARGWLISRFSSADRDRPYRVVADWRRQSSAAPRRIAALPPGCSPEADAARALLRRQPRD